MDEQCEGERGGGEQKTAAVKLRRAMDDVKHKNAKACSTHTYTHTHTHTHTQAHAATSGLLDLPLLVHCKEGPAVQP